MCGRVSERLGQGPGGSCGGLKADAHRVEHPGLAQSKSFTSHALFHMNSCRVGVGNFSPVTSGLCVASVPAPWPLLSS